MKPKTKKNKHSEDVSDVTVPTVINKIAPKISNLKKKKKVKIIKQQHDEFKLPFPGAYGGSGNKPAEQPKIESLIGTEIGDSGIRNIAGIIQEEYNPALNGILGIRIYDEMRRSDGTIRAAMQACTLPVRKSKWRIEAAGEEPQDLEAADFIQRNLFELMSEPFGDFLRQALLMLPFGVMPFEKVYVPQEVEGKTMIILQKLAPRMPKTIYRWRLNDGSLGIQQQRQDGVLAEIPMTKMAVFVNEKEGENWWGISLLRPAYKHWFIKNQFYKIDAIAFERQGLGVPYVKLPQGATDSDKKQAQAILQNLRANENAYIIEPFTYEMGFKDMMAHTVRDPNASIMHHNREILKSVLAQFLDLGASKSGSSGGSKALSQDHSQLFLQSLEAIAESFKGVVNRYIIPQLCDLNYDLEDYPTLEYAGISEVDAAGLATAYQTLVNAGGLKPIDNDEMFFRDLMNLPELTAEELAEREAQEQENIAKGLNPDGTAPEINPLLQDDSQEIDQSTTKNKAKVKKPGSQGSGAGDSGKEQDMASFVNASEQHQNFKKKRNFNEVEIQSAIEDKLTQMSTANKLVFFDKSLKVLNNMRCDSFFSAVKKILTEKQADLRSQIFKEYNDYKGWRPLTLAEKKVDFSSISAMMDKLEGQFEDAATAHLQEVKDAYIKKLSKMLHDGDINGVKDLAFKLQGDYKQIVKETLGASYTYGKNNASRELGVDTPATPQDINSLIELQADTITRDHFNKLISEAKFTTAEQMSKDLTTAQVIAIVDKALDDKIAHLVADTRGIIVPSSLNQGRRTVFLKNSKNIYALQRSEVLDQRTCNYCLSMDGRIISKDDELASADQFHSDCRGIWVSIMMDEVDKPDISGVPQSLRDRFGGSVNDLEQPKNPIVKKSSLAGKFINDNTDDGIIDD